jgi:ribonuclease HI
MAAFGRSALRDLFDDSPTPYIAHPPQSHHRDFYVATDGSYRPDGGGLGAVIETRDGHRVARVSLPDAPPDNNVAEYRALHLGLDTLADRAPAEAAVGVLVDHDDLARQVNATVLGAGGDWTPPRPVRVPAGVGAHWRGIEARVAQFGDLRVARIDGRENPAHPLANAPEEYAHLRDRPARCVIPEAPTPAESDAGETTRGNADGVLPPSRRQRRQGASD